MASSTCQSAEHHMMMKIFTKHFRCNYFLTYTTTHKKLIKFQSSSIDFFSSCWPFSILVFTTSQIAVVKPSIKIFILYLEEAVTKKPVLCKSEIWLFIDLVFVKKKMTENYIWGLALYGADTRITGFMETNYLESFKMWTWMRIQNYKQIW